MFNHFKTDESNSRKIKLLYSKYLVKLLNTQTPVDLVQLFPKK